MCVYFSVVPLSATHRDSHQAVLCCAWVQRPTIHCRWEFKVASDSTAGLLKFQISLLLRELELRKKSDVGDLQWRISVFCIPICCVWCLCRITQLYSNKFRCSDFLWRHFDDCSRRFDGLQANCSTHEWIREISSTTTSSSIWGVESSNLVSLNEMLQEK